jgi:indolepyruvate ferredoxin oxidoreductase
MAALKSASETFKGSYEIRHHLAPPLFSKRDPDTGHLLKQEFGPWIRQAMNVLAKFRFLRGTALDPFGHTQERKTERQLIADYKATVSGLLDTLSAATLRWQWRLPRVPEHIRGYGHVKERHLVEARSREAMLVDAYKAGKSRAPVYMAAE